MIKLIGGVNFIMLKMAQPENNRKVDMFMILIWCMYFIVAFTILSFFAASLISIYMAVFFSCNPFIKVWITTFSLYNLMIGFIIYNFREAAKKAKNWLYWTFFCMYILFIGFGIYVYIEKRDDCSSQLSDYALFKIIFYLLLVIVSLVFKLIN